MAGMRGIRKTKGEAPSEQGAGARQRGGAGKGSGRKAASSLHERYIAGVPARIMRPRLVFLACLAALVCFGLLMVYSASSVEALKENGSATYFLFRQGLFVLAGGVGALCLALGIPFDLQRFRQGGAHVLLIACAVMLLVVFLFGENVGGAKRWLNLGFFSLQPSELSKPVVILLAAQALSEYFEERSIDFSQLVVALTIGVAVPLALIIIEPDLGTTIIIAGTVVAMACLAGLPTKTILMVAAAFVVIGVAAVIAEPYRMTRFLVATDPWADPYDTGYQATLAIMAFASGGLFGRGIGNSTMKYNYLPEAHNDFILAVIGEEVGFVGMLAFLAVFLLLIYAAFKVAEQSPTLYGKLTAAGCAVILGLQFFVNALGVIGVTPMTGKTLPFISYGGSSMISCLLLAGLIVRVSVESFDNNPYHARRASFAVVDEEDEVSGYVGRSTAGAVTTRRGTRSDGFSVYDGGAAARPGRDGRTARGGHPVRDGRAGADRGRGSSRPVGGARASGPRERIDLSADPTERLRGRGTRGEAPRGGRGQAGPGSRDRRGRRDGYDR